MSLTVSLPTCTTKAARSFCRNLPGELQSWLFMGLLRIVLSDHGPYQICGSRSHLLCAFPFHAVAQLK